MTMTCVAINVDWYNQIKNRVKTENPWFYKTHYGYREHFMVEVDVEEEQFNAVSRELGWME